ncbi:MAG: hypothetical protein M0035_06435 [Actinomycetota bacterium]|jgi:hypothetical protein|nr:hypothetical protein [Actinomycetota bacterium]
MDGTSEHGDAGTFDNPALGTEPFVLESCHSTWIFDPERMRFRRILKGLDLDAHQATTAWRAYFGLELDPLSESFVVLLNPDGSRLLRSWRHLDHCAQCGGEPTTELGREDLLSASRS